MRFLVDAQLPPKLAKTLIELGHQAEHLENVGLRHAKDGDIWTYAVSNQAVIVSKDEDFVDRFRRRGGGPVIVWLRIGNSSNRVLLAWIVPVLPAIVQRIRAGDLLIEVRQPKPLSPVRAALARRALSLWQFVSTVKM